MAVIDKYDEILGFYHLPEDGNDYSEPLLPYVQKLEAVVDAAKAYKDAELASTSHGAACPICSQDENECEASGELWLAEMRTMKAMWDSLAALED